MLGFIAPVVLQETPEVRPLVHAQNLPWAWDRHQLSQLGVVNVYSYVSAMTVAPAVHLECLEIGMCGFELFGCCCQVHA